MILFVCTGNTCRSPMAAALAAGRGMTAESAGLAAYPGAPATPEAQRAAARYGADLSRHRARQIDETLAARARRIYVMTAAQAARLRALFPAQAEKIFALCPEIPDPYGGGPEEYALCAAQLLRAVEGLGGDDRA